MSSYRLPISARDYGATLAAAAVALVLIHLGLNLYNYRVEELPWLLLQLFELDEENNLPTWFSSFLLLNNAFVLYLVARQQFTEKAGYWGMLALGFLVLAIDEVAGLHESFNTAIDTNWAIFGGVLVLLVAVAFVPFLLSLPRHLAVMFFISGALYVAGAIVTELLSEDMDSDSLAYALAVALEEGLEMAGAWLFLFVNLRHMAGRGHVQIDLPVE